MDLQNKVRELSYRIHTQLLTPRKSSFNGMILMFHRVVEELEELRHSHLARLHVTTRHLENLIVGLREQGYEIISLDDLRLTLESNKQNTKFAVFTFDDAYRDTFELAFPIFEKHCAPFTVYVPTAVPDNYFIWWYYMLDDLVFRNIEIDTVIMGEPCHYELRTDEQKFHAYKNIEGLVNSIEPKRRGEELEKIFSGYGLDSREYNKKLSMSWEQLDELHRSGLATIGGHSVNHNNLAHMSLEDAHNEIQLGRKRIEEKLGIPVDHFCYPFGCRSAAHFREFDLAKSIGFKTCTTTRHGYITSNHRNYTERLPRIMVEEITTTDLLVR